VPSRWFNAGILGHYRAYHEALILILIVLLISSISYLAWMANSHVLHHVPLRDREWIRWELDDGSDRCEFHHHPHHHPPHSRVGSVDTIVSFDAIQSSHHSIVASRDTPPDSRADLENLNNGNLTGGVMHAIMTDGTISERLSFGNYWVDGLGHFLDVYRVSRVGILVLLPSCWTESVSFYLLLSSFLGTYRCARFRTSFGNRTKPNWVTDK
jgi:hypothetical protein